MSDADEAAGADAAPAVAWPPPADEAEKASRVVALRERLTGDCAGDSQVSRFCTDGTLERFTRACCYDVDKAEDFMRKALRWRADKQPWAATCPGCAASPRAHSLRCVGTDAEGRPVLYHCFAQADGRHVAAHNTAHLMRILEDCCVLMDSQEPQITQWVWVFDFHGYGLWDNNPSTVVAAAQFLPLHPNRLYKVNMLDAPTAFSAVWGVVSGFLTDITKAKITFTSLAQLRDVAAGWTGDEMASWLEAEATENRALTAAGARAAGAKRYWEAPPAAGPGEAAVHDPRGTASFIASPLFFSPTHWGGAAEASAPPGEGEEPPPQPPARSGSWLWGSSAATT